MKPDSRLCGVILHPTSLPGPHGAGDLGPAAYHFVDWLAVAGQSLWQVLPLNPIGPGNSPYAGASAFAGNPLLVALEPLVEQGWLAASDTVAEPPFPADSIDFGRVIPFRLARLKLAGQAFLARGSAADRASFNAYCAREARWLDDYALFMALDELYQSRGIHAWPQWAPGIARRTPDALATARLAHADAIAFWQFVQWCFDTQWAALKRYANDKGIRIVGDLPIFVAHHSVDCWARTGFFYLDKTFAPTVVGGVPPDFFSETGQRWGNPLYRWEAMRKDGFRWWIDRVRRQFDLADYVRIDHFRGFAGYWEIPATALTAIEGRWVNAPGVELFTTIERELGRLPVIAEDLGVITPDVVALRERFRLPGMRILQFAFTGEADSAFLPHNYETNTVAFTGTHDNNTTRGWWSSCTERERNFARSYLQCTDDDVHWAAIRSVIASVARFAMYPLQDVLGLDASHRMNTPAVTGCWAWRFVWDNVPPDAAARLASISATYGRASFTRLSLPDYPADMRKP
jgi:4-alpha-glucanotransferase